MKSSLWRSRVCFAAGSLLAALSLARSAAGSDVNALIMSQFNAVSGSNYLDSGMVDPQLGRVEGNGQNWMQLLTTKTDPGRNTLNLQGYEIDWSYRKDGSNFGSGWIKFSSDPVWAAVPLGTSITINEWEQAWYKINTVSTDPGYDTKAPHIGMQRDGGVSGLGLYHGTVYGGDPSVEKLIGFSSNTAWNPNAPSGPNMAPGPNWNINVFAGQLSGDHFRYFSFGGSVTNNGIASAIGTDAGGLFAINNDDWQFTIRDRSAQIVQGPIGESLSGWGGGGINNTEVGHLQASALDTAHHPTLSTWQNVTIASYSDANSSNYGGPSIWTNNSTAVRADLSPLRNWFSNIKLGDVNLDGIVNSADITIVASNWLRTGGGWLSGDIDGNGIVNAADIAIISSHWLQFGGAPSSITSTAAGPGAIPIPEPASGTLCIIGAVFGLAWRLSCRRRKA